MKLRMTKTLRFWANVAAEHAKSDLPKLTKRQLVAQILREYERRGDAMRCLNGQGKISWKASPRFLSMLGEAERDALDDLDDSP
jgi:acid phosphatase class B